MLFRALIGTCVLVGGVGGYMFAVGPSLVLGSIKDDYVAGIESGGIDMSDCKKRQRTLIDPSGGMRECMRDVVHHIDSKLREIEDGDVEPRYDSSSEPSQEAPPLD